MLRKPFRYQLWNASFMLIGINVAVYLLIMLFPRLYNYLALNTVAVIRYRMYWQPFTYMFVHGGLTHLLFNMLGLVFFGISAEKAIGSKEFMLFYLVTGTVSGLVSLVMYIASGSYYVVLVGASGAVYAVLLAFAVFYPRSRIFIWGILPVPAPLLVLFYVGLAIFNQVFSMGRGIAHMTHLAGFAAAWLYLVIRMGVNPIKVWKNAYR
jgi:membrane associated rhomboid family serine protease